MSNQKQVKVNSKVQSGKAFEYAILLELKERLIKFTEINVVKDNSLSKVKNEFEKLDTNERSRFRLSASSAVNFLVDIEPRLTNGLSTTDVLELQVASDVLGQSGDVRDIIIVRSTQKWEIGISAKNNHRAVKHSRLSNNIDFGSEWLDMQCSEHYFSAIHEIFSVIDERIKKNKATKWSDFEDKQEKIYVPVLKAFKDELMRLQDLEPKKVPRKLTEYLIGRKDYYKVIRENRKVEVHAFNLHGSLNKKIGNAKPKASIKKLKLPNKVLDISFKKDSKTTVLVSLDEGWQFSFRIHSADSTLERSLKFDINLISTPHTLFTNHIIINGK